jgi:hypothetical protein
MMGVVCVFTLVAIALLVFVVFELILLARLTGALRHQARWSRASSAAMAAEHAGS